MSFFTKNKKSRKKSKKYFKNLLTNREKGCIIDKLNTARPVGQAVKTLASHAENMGSIPVRVTNEKRKTLRSGCLSFFVCAPHKLEPTCAMYVRADLQITSDAQGVLPLGALLDLITLVLLIDRTISSLGKIPTLSVCATLLRRFRVGSLVGRSKFPYKIPSDSMPLDLLFCR